MHLKVKTKLLAAPWSKLDMANIPIINCAVIQIKLWFCCDVGSHHCIMMSADGHSNMRYYWICCFLLCVLLCRFYLPKVLRKSQMVKKATATCWTFHFLLCDGLGAGTSSEEPETPSIVLTGTKVPRSHVIWCVSSWVVQHAYQVLARKSLKRMAVKGVRNNLRCSLQWLWICV